MFAPKFLPFVFSIFAKFLIDFAERWHQYPKHKYYKLSVVCGFWYKSYCRKRYLKHEIINLQKWQRSLITVCTLWKSPSNDIVTVDFMKLLCMFLSKDPQKNIEMQKEANQMTLSSTDNFSVDEWLIPWSEELFM